MLNTRVLITVFVFLYSAFTVAQTTDSLPTKRIFKKTIVPATFIGVGVMITNSQFEQNLQTNIRTKVGDDYHFPIDDYAQYVPIVELYLADVFNVESKNHWFDQTKYLIMSNIISSGVTHILKSTIKKPRPDGSADNSFPSGHTSFSFTNATVLFNEFQQTSPLLAYSGYVFSTTTGFFRVINNKHWLSDVLVGAGIGILATHIVYYFEPLKAFNPFKKSKNVMFLPQMNKNGYGLYFSYVF